MRPKSNNNIKMQDGSNPTPTDTGSNIQIEDPSRRRLIQATLMGVASSAVVLPAAAQPAETSIASDRIPAREAFENLTLLEAETLDAMLDRILPADENGPGARAARAIHFIDRSLGSFNAQHRAVYATSLQLLYEQAEQHHALRFSQLSPGQQDALLAQMDADALPGIPASFFSLVRTHTLQGTFSDPCYGGNHQFIGWDLLGYPGVRLITSADDVAQGRALAPTHVSAYDHALFTKSAGESGRGH